MTPTPRLVCAACEWTPGSPAVDPYPFRCPNSGSDDGDHVMTVTPASVAEGFRPGAAPHVSVADQNPFVRYRGFLYSWHVAVAHGISDADYLSLVETIDRSVAHIWGCGFRATPFVRSEPLSRQLGFTRAGGVWVKDETGNVSGSHKARHLMGVAMYLKVLERLGVGDPARPLAVASCGNAALAAAVIARAIGRRLLVFVPVHASAPVIARLEQLGACVTRCSRTGAEDEAVRAGDVLENERGVRALSGGDPCYRAFRRAVEDGALPFSCQGNENGLAIEGGSTLAWEMIDEAMNGSAPEMPDCLVVQVGGGALASACVRAFSACAASSATTGFPRIHSVQTRGGYPLKRAYDRLMDQVFVRLAETVPGTRLHFATDGDRARYVLRAAPATLLDETFRYARHHRHEFMWPWETEPRSVAGGILDDETYDWAVVVEAMVRSGGFPVVVDEETLEETNAFARSTTGIDVDHTGSAGLAGLIALSRSLARPAPSERVAVLFTGIRR